MEFDMTPVGNRELINGLVFCVFIAFVLGRLMPFQDNNNLLQLTLLEKPYLFYALKGTYNVLLFTTTYIIFTLLMSLVYIFADRKEPAILGGKLPQYPEVADRDKLFVIVGEVHHAKRQEPAEDPRWLII